MADEAGPVSGPVMDVEELEEPDLDMDMEEAKGTFDEKRQHSGNNGARAELYGFLPAYPVCVPQDGWGIRGGGEDIQDKLLHSCCTAGGSSDQPSPSSTLEYWVYLDNQHDMEDCPVPRTITPPATPVTHRPCPFLPVPGSGAAVASAPGSLVNPVVSSPNTDTCSPTGSVCSPTGSAWDTFRSTSGSPGCSDSDPVRDPVRAAAHLHLLGESLSLIGHHLQETNKTVSMSSSLSLLLDSLLCALAPLVYLTAEVPELRSCTRNTLASTLENLAYVMPGL